MKPGASLWHLYGFPLLLIAACMLTAVGLFRAGATDFLTFTQSGRQLLAGGDAYFPFVPHRGPNLNPPWIVMLMAPLSALPYRAGLAVWSAISLVCLMASAILIARTIAPGQSVAIACAVLVTQAAFSNLGLGQVAWPLMLLMTMAWRADRSDRPVACGLALGLAAAWKPFLLVFLPYLVWRRAWRTLLAMTVAMALTIVVGLFGVGVSGYRSWFAALQLVQWEGLPLNASVRAVLTRILMVSEMTELRTTPIVVAPAWRDVAWLAVSSVIAAVTVIRIMVKREIDRAWAGLGLMALLISPLGWVHYVPVVTGPVLAVLLAAGRPTFRLAIAGWLLLCVPFMWLKSTAFGPWLTATVASSYAWGVLILLAAVLASRSSSVPNQPSASV